MANAPDTTLMTGPNFAQIGIGSARITPNGTTTQTTLAAVLANIANGVGAFSNMTLTGLLFESSTDNITARAGGGQALATALTTEMNRIATVATAGDSVKLPASAAGLTIIIENAAANPVQVYGAGTDTINGVATATGVSQMASSVVIYTCYTAGAWYANGLGTGYNGSFETMSYVNGLTAFAGGGQASGTLLTAMMNRVTTVATIGDSVKLPPAIAGLQIMAANAATNSMNVFPNTGDQINALGANAAYAQAGGKTATFYCVSNGTWHALLSA